MTHTVRLAVGHADLAAGVVHGRDGTRELTTTEVKLLAYLVAHPGRPLPRSELLKEVWGYRTGVVTRTVDTTIRRLREKVEPDPSAPVHLITVHGVGYRFDPAPASEAPEPEPERWPDADRFVGRAAELLALRAWWAGGGDLATLVGPAGAGKTRLAQQLMRSCRPGSFADLSHADDEAGVIDAVGAALEAGDAHGDARAWVGRALREAGAALVVLDNAEQAVDAVAACVRAWREHAPRCRFLVTSREALRLSGELAIAVDGLEHDDAAALYRDRAGAAAGEEEGLDALLDTLERLPLAVELAAAWAPLLSPSELERRVRSSPAFLGPGRRDAPARHRTLEAAVASSWTLLEARERSALSRCAVFAGWFPMGGAEAVAGDDAPRALRRLCEQSLIRTEARRGMRLFRLYNAVRAYALEQLAPEELEAIRSACTAWLLSLPPRPAVLEALRGDLLAAHARALQTDPESAARLALGLVPLLSARGPAHQLAAALERTLAAAHGIAPELRARLASALGRELFHSARRSDAPAVLDEALRCARAAADDRLVATVLGTRAAVAVQLSDDTGAARALDEALHLCPPRDTVVRATLTRFEGHRLLYAGDRTAAAERYRKALEILGPGAPSAQEGMALADLGTALHHLGALDEALERFTQALELFTELADGRSQGHVVEHIAVVHLERGELARADAELQRAVELDRAVDFRPMGARHRARLGTLRQLQGRAGEAVVHYRAAADRFRALGDTRSEGTARALLGGALAVGDERGAARAQLRAASEQLEASGGALGMALAQACSAYPQLVGTGRSGAMLAEVAGAAARCTEVRLAIALVRAAS